MGKRREIAAGRHAELVEEIRAHDRRYYVDSAAIVSDREYDRLFAELKDLERDHPELVTRDSPTQRVGAQPVDGFERVPHPRRMYSLDNTYDEGELRDFLKRVKGGLGDEDAVELVVEPKLDGASMELIYRDGILQAALTRGDGIEGENVTSNVRTIRSLPLRIPSTGEVIARGEIIINMEDLEAVNRERKERSEPAFANPRNAAAGSLRLLDPAITSRRPLRIILYELVDAPGMPGSHVECLEWLADQGLPTHGMQRVCMSTEEVTAAISDLDAKRAELPFEIDGAVVKVDREDLRERLGFTARFPRWAVAYKFEAQQARTRLIDILVQVGRTGALTPVAVLEPVLLVGTTISRASLHNEDEIRSKDIRVGDMVIVEKAGEIIPQVVEVIRARDTERGDPFVMPTTCPVCGGPTGREEGEARWRCTNRLACPGQLKAALRHFALRSAMDIEHLGPSLIDQLVTNELVRDPADLFSLTVEQVEGLDRMAEKSARNLIAAIDKSREKPLDRLITGLGIPLVGEVAAVQLAPRYGNLSGFFQAIPAVQREELAAIHGIGDKIADSIANSLEDERFMGVVKRLLDLGVDPVARGESEKGSLFGMSFCLTGKLFEPRARIQERIRAAGGEVHSAVKKGTGYLVTGEKVGKSKIQKARDAGTEIIDEETLMGMMEKQNG